MKAATFILANLMILTLQAQTIREWYDRFPHKHQDFINVPDCADSVLTDTKNAFLFIKCWEYGVPVENTFTYFVKADKSKVFAYRYFNDGGAGSPESLTRFYTFSNGTWTDVTKQVLPAVGFSDFWDKTKPLPAANYQRVIYEYVLPRFGTTIVVKVHTESTVDNFIAADYYDVLAPVLKRTVQLVWNRELGKFIKN
ncbi:MAG: hypothetical protein KF687_00550 [Cyclobacteriaceae bacterium]|nr:hypothetical protein [Cyclobacteriaceae bacterium]